MPPLPPPKPRTNFEAKMNAATADHYSEQTRGSDQVITRAHSALPASVRPNPTIRPSSPTEERIATPRAIEPDLVAKDRYDPASKCFSYVPARALSEHFTAPRKPQRVKMEETASESLDAQPSASEIALVPVISTDLQRLPETPKWEDDIEKISNGVFFGQHSGQTEMNTTPIDFNGPIANSTPKMNLSKSDYSADNEEKPIVVEQAKRISKRRKTKFGSYKTLNDDAYNSDLDDLCDPDFYLTYATQPTASVTSSTVGSSNINGDLIRKDKSQPSTDLALIDDQNLKRSKPEHFTKNAATVAGAKMNELRSTELSVRPYSDQSTVDAHFSSPKPATSLANISQEREAFRMRNCRSATSAPFYRESHGNRLFAHNRYDSLTDAENADDWLKFQLRKLKAKRENNPEVLRRKRQEKLLLEELKHVNGDRQMTRGRDEHTYSVEGYGQTVDPLAEYRVEEERLQNLCTPYQDSNVRVADELMSTVRRTEYGSSSVLPPKPSDAVRHKPPTPPLRPRSQSPSSSPYPRRYRIRTPLQETAYQRERNHINRNDNIEHDIGDLDDNEFSHLRNIVKF
uniref:Uncharacterized protein n=1 Tax=Setaria digitata TaxID=48799 RepID=A0A915PFF6_9BILA